ncbi:MAG: hypothetical protein KDN19_10760 [Verrucomicrobiae bacterium]|nr:hypothetical protein [Verrucomicrobiae bacterium]
MSDAAANCTLELACTVGSVADATEALEEGADINSRGGAPLFNAIFNRNIEVIRLLIENDVDLSNFVSPAMRLNIRDIDELIEILLECAPPDPKAIDPGLMGEMDATIRKSGLGKPVLEGDWDGVCYYIDKLKRIGLTEMSEIVAEFVSMFEPAKSWGDAALFEAIKADKKKIAKLTERYVGIECESIETLARAFLDAEENRQNEKPTSPAKAAEPTVEAADSDDITAVAV